jgi:ABC-type branched-subunit amino acid transport system substrate-binding protein
MAGLALAGALACAGCGSTSTRTESQTIPVGRTLDVYASLPLHGPLWRSGGATLSGIEAALSAVHDTAGPWSIHFVPLDDTAASTGLPDLARAADNARKANQDAGAILYIGDLTAPTTQVAIPILNAAGIPQIGLSSSAASLTAVHGSAAVNQYPTGMRTFLSLVPSDSVQASADLAMMQRARCGEVALAHDQAGSDLAAALWSQRGLSPLSFVADTDIDQATFDPAQYVQGLRPTGTGERCLFFAGSASPAAVRLADAVHQIRRPPWQFFGGDGICTPEFTAPPGGVSPAAYKSIECTSPVPDLSTSAAGRAFLRAYGEHAGAGQPPPQAALGYEAMELALAAIKTLGAGADSRQAVLHQILATSHQSSLLGPLRFNASTGASTLRSYYVYQIRNGRLQLASAITPS